MGTKTQETKETNLAQGGAMKGQSRGGKKKPTGKEKQRKEKKKIKKRAKIKLP